jgi:hypothetical protein
LYGASEQTAKMIVPYLVMYGMLGPEAPMDKALADYFEQPDTPARNSPIGLLMQRILVKNPGMDFAAARTEAHCLQQLAARRKTYQFPPILSPEEKRQRLEALERRLKKSRE